MRSIPTLIGSSIKNKYSINLLSVPRLDNEYLTVIIDFKIKNINKIMICNNNHYNNLKKFNKRKW